MTTERFRWYQAEIDRAEAGIRSLAKRLGVNLPPPLLPPDKEAELLAALNDDGDFWKEAHR